MKSKIIHRNKLSNKKIGKKNGGNYKLTKKTLINNKLKTKKNIKKYYQRGGTNGEGPASGPPEKEFTFKCPNQKLSPKINDLNDLNDLKCGQKNIDAELLALTLRDSGAFNTDNSAKNDVFIKNAAEEFARNDRNDRNDIRYRIAKMFNSEDLIKDDAEDATFLKEMETYVNNGELPPIISGFFEKNENAEFDSIRKLMEKMCREAIPKNPFRYEYKPPSEWKDDVLSSPKKMYDWYVSKNPGFLPIRQQTREYIDDLESKTKIYLETEDSNFVTKKKAEVARYRKKLEEFRKPESTPAMLKEKQVRINTELGFDENNLFAISEHLRKITEELLRLVGSKATITDFLTQPDLDKLPRLPPPYPSCIKKLDPSDNEIKTCESESSVENPIVAGVYTWESKSLDQSPYPVIKVPEYDFLVMGMVKDLLLVQCLKTMPVPPKKQPKPVFHKSDNANERRSKGLSGAVITDEIRANSLKLLKKFESLIAEGYLYTEFIECLIKYLLFFSIGRLIANSNDLRVSIQYLESLTKTCFIILPTFEQINFKKILNSCAAPVLKLRLPNTRIYAHTREAGIAFELYHDLLNHSFRTHQITKYIPGYTGQYLGKILFLVKNEFRDFRYKYQPSKIECMYGIISRRIIKLFDVYNYDDKQIKASQMTLEQFRVAVDIKGQLTEEEKYIFAIMLYFLFHEMKNYCLHDLNFNKKSLENIFQSLLPEKEFSDYGRILYHLLSSEFQPRFMKVIFTKDGNSVKDLINHLRQLIKKCLMMLPD